MSEPRPPKVRIGLEALEDGAADPLPAGRLGLLCNQASVDHRFRGAPGILAAARPGDLAALFSPQHGLWSEQQDNMVESAHHRHPELGVPVYSLYSETRRPTDAMLDGLDALVVDLPDVGCRVYTYAWTVSLCLEACAARGIPVVILDRPNPLGALVEGRRLDPAFTTFVGRAAVPMCHGLTLGELTRGVNEWLGIGGDVRVVPVRGWSREMRHRETGREWVPPSPNLPRAEGALVYPGQVLFEGTNVSEGRGTTTPFEQFGAPWLRPAELLEELRAIEWPAGVVLRPVRFEPTFHKYAGQSCGGLFLHVVDADEFRPLRTTLTLLAALARRWPAEFQLTAPPYEYETERAPLDCITGATAVREALAHAADFSSATLDALCDPGDWDAAARPFLEYPATLATSAEEPS